MEVTVLEVMNTPARPLIAVHAGSVRRQVRMEVNHSFQIPAPLETVTKGVEVTLFQHLASHALPAEDTRAEVVCSLPVQRADGSTSEVKLRIRREGDGRSVPAAGGDDDARLVDGRQYLEQHRLETCVQDLLQEVMREQPNDPYRYMQERLRARKSKNPEETTTAPEETTASEESPSTSPPQQPLVPRPPAGKAPTGPSPRKVMHAAASAPEDKARSLHDFGGFYWDPAHVQPGTFAGARMVSVDARDGDEAGLVLVGSDDGRTFWAVSGKVTSVAAGSLFIDFSPKGGPAECTARVQKGAIEFDDGNCWPKAAEPSGDVAPEEDHPVGEVVGSFGGLYTDARHLRRGSFAGTRMLAETRGAAPGESDDLLVLVGSDDGADFWTARGRVVARETGALELDLSSKGGPKLAATFADGRLTFEDGNAWARQPSPSSLL